MSRSDPTVPDCVPVSATTVLAPPLSIHILDDFDDIAIAVSGGSDSIALLYLLHDWAKSKGKNLSVLTVDHQLRDASQNEAAFVGALCAQIGLDHHILTWDGDKPSTGLSSAARTARYDLMAAYCARHSIQALALGHTRDDQVETIFMRLQRTNAENRGLSGMAATTLFSPDPACHVMLCRPLLDVTRHELRRYLSNQGVDWVEDPTNKDNQYERVRLRDYLAHKPQLAQRLAEYADIHSRYRRHMASDAARFIERHCSVSDFNCVLIQRSKLDQQPLPITILVLQVLLSVVGGRYHLPSSIKVMDALNRAAPSTLARVHMNRTQTHLILHREVRNLPSAFRLEGGATLWDQRFWLIKSEGADYDVEVFCGNNLKHGVEELIKRYDSDEFSHMAKFEKNACAALPFGRFYDKYKRSADFILKSEEIIKGLTVLPAFGAFDRYCTDFDFPIRHALVQLFTVKRLNR